MGNRPFEIKHLKKWENNLNGCIRCGYCYEHCPIFKHTRWESDSPRAKLIMIYGLLSGNLEPSEYMAEKIFSCFFCRQCEAACSSGVPLTDIFMDAKKDFEGTQYDTLGTTSFTGLDCALCLSCVRACPHEARTLVDGKIVTDPTKCHSCGICVDICPKQTVEIGKSYGTDRIHLNREITTFMANDNAKAVVFGCNWSLYPGLQSSILEGQSDADSEYKILINMCGGRLEKPLLLEPFLQDAWGVLVACCPEGECQHDDGNLKARAHVAVLKNVMEKMGINPERIQYREVAQGDQAGFQESIDTFMENLHALGPVTRG